MSRARLSQIMDLLMLAPEIQEEILLLPSTVSGRDSIHERRLRELSAGPDWQSSAVQALADDDGAALIEGAELRAS